MTRDDLARFAALPIDHEAIGLMEPGVPQEPYFCDPVGGEPVGRIGCDGVHFILLPGDERVFCVDPAMGEPGTYVLPVAELSRPRFDALLEEGWQTVWPQRDAALEAIAAAFGLESADPYEKVKALQAGFDPACLRFSAEYYDILGLKGPEREEP